VIWGLASQYHYFATAVHLSGTPAGGIFTGTGVINGVFYPRIAGIGAHIITYTVDNGSCVSQDAKQTLVTMDATNLPGGFTVQLFDNPGTQPMLWVVTLEASPIEITLLNETGQTLQTWIKSVNPGTNNIYLDVTRYPKALYFLRVFHAATGKTMTLKMVN
jgi:hypothetical protein